MMNPPFRLLFNFYIQNILYILFVNKHCGILTKTCGVQVFYRCGQVWIPGGRGFPRLGWAYGANLR